MLSCVNCENSTSEQMIQRLKALLSAKIEPVNNVQLN